MKTEEIVRILAGLNAPIDSERSFCHLCDHLWEAEDVAANESAGRTYQKWHDVLEAEGRESAHKWHPVYPNSGWSWHDHHPQCIWLMATKLYPKDKAA